MTDTATKEPDYLGHRARLKQRFMNDEGKSMPDYELIELLLTYVIPRRDVKPIAKNLIRKFGSLSAVLMAKPNDLQEIDGVKESSVVLFKAIKEAARRLAWSELSDGDKPVISNWDAMIDYCRTEMALLDVEDVKMAMEKKASAVILVHNHPSGDVKPSRADIDMTKQIKIALESIGIALVDHIIIGKNNYNSLKSLQVI